MVTVAALLVLVACGSGGGKKSASTTVTTASSTTVGAGAPRAISGGTTTRPPDLTLGVFRSPTNNIGCGVDAATTRCDIRAHSWTPPPNPRRCDADRRNGAEGPSNGAGTLACARGTGCAP